MAKHELSKPPKGGTSEKIFCVTVLAGVCPFGLMDVVRGQRLFWGILQNLQKRFASKRHRGATTLINSCLSVVDFVQSVESKTWHSKSQKTKMDSLLSDLDGPRGNSPISDCSTPFLWPVK